MPRSNRVRVSLAAWLICFGIGSVPMGAGEALAAPAADDSRAEARERFDRGLKLFNQGDNEGALAEFQRAYRLTGNVVALYNLARVHAASGEAVQALEALELLRLPANEAALPKARQREILRLYAQLERRVGTVSLTSSVTLLGARVEVDGADAGELEPGKPLRLTAGRHLVAVLVPGHYPLRKTLTLAGEEHQTLQFVPELVQGTPGKLRFSVRPMGVAVLLDGQELGRSPHLVEVAVAPGPHRLVLERPGYRRVERVLAVPEGGVLEISDQLASDGPSRAGHEGRLHLEISETEGLVSIDGHAIGSQVSDVVLPEGEHRLRIERAFFAPVERTVNVVRGTQTRVKVTLQPTPAYRADFTASARFRRAVALGIGIGGALALGGSTAFLLWNHGQTKAAETAFDAAFHSAEGACKPAETAECSHASAIASIRSDDLTHKRDRQVPGWVGLGVGVAALGTGALLWLTGADPRRYEPRPESDVFGSLQVSFWVDAGCSGALLSGRF